MESNIEIKINDRILVHSFDFLEEFTKIYERNSFKEGREINDLFTELISMDLHYKLYVRQEGEFIMVGDELLIEDLQDGKYNVYVTQWIPISQNPFFRHYDANNISANKVCYLVDRLDKAIKRFTS